jgi:hypothetical protein
MTVSAAVILKIAPKRTEETEPTDNPELGVVIDVVVQDGRSQSTKLSHGGTETVGGSSDGDGEDFSGDEEGGAVGTELLEESGKEVDGLETVDVCGFSEVVVRHSGDKLERRVSICEDFKSPCDSRRE